MLFFQLFTHRFVRRTEYEFLSIYVKDIKKNKELIDYTIELRNKKQNELFQNDHDFKLKNDYLKINFIEYFENLALNRKRPDKSVHNTLKHLKIFTKNRPVTFKVINKKFCEDFREYLIKTLGSMNTAHSYFSKLKATLNKAMKDEIINRNPAHFIHISKQDTKREFLTIDELKILKKTPCKNEQIKNAFFFACYTGLRISDLNKLEWSEIRNDYLYFAQQKTKNVGHLKLSHTALEIIDRQNKLTGNSEKVFKLISDNHSNVILREWAKNTGINKTVTWHVSRHTFATMALTYDNDIYTVSKLLGHREIKTTQIYARLIDKKKDEAIDKLPKL